MKTLIIGDDYKRSCYLKQAFQMENLRADTVFSYSEVALKELMPHYRFIILLSDNFERIKEWYGLCGFHHTLLKLLVLCSDLSAELINFAKVNNVQLYTRPFPVRGITNDIKMSIYDFNENFNNSYVIRDLELDVGSHQVKMNNKIVYLRNKEFNLLHFLLQNRGKIVSRNTLLEQIWDRNANLMTNTVEVHISNLRKKIEKNNESKYIYTYPCAGYMLN